MGSRVLPCTCGRSAVESTIDEPHEATVIRCPSKDTCPSHIIIRTTSRGARATWNRSMREIEAERSAKEVPRG